MLSPTITTERLILRRFKESDIDMQYEIITDKRLATYLKFSDISKEEELQCIKNWIKNADTDECEKWVITLKENNKPIGNISVGEINKDNNYCSIGYIVLFDYWKQGYTTEATIAISNYLLNERKYYLVEAYCNENNKASSSVLIKSGFKKDGYVANRRKNLDGTYSGLDYYSKRLDN